MLVAMVEGVKASREWHSPAGATIVGDAAVLMPLATAVGLGVSVAMMTLDPDRRWTLGAALGAARAMPRERRARASARWRCSRRRRRSGGCSPRRISPRAVLLREA